MAPIVLSLGARGLMPALSRAADAFEHPAEDDTP